MKNIGIITHWNVPNYGSFLQAYALRRHLEQVCKNTDVRLVNYIKPVHIKMYYSFEVHEAYKWWFINPRYYRDILRRTKRWRSIVRTRRFLSYYDRLIPHTEKFTSKTIVKKDFDFLIFGSDIVWDYSIGFFGHDEISFGCDLKANYKISYAASFGTVKRRVAHPVYVKNGLKEFDAISVRDDNSAGIVEDITGKLAKVVIDPTLLWDFSRDEKIPQNRKKANYIAVYGSGFTEGQADFLVKYAKSNNLRLVNVGDAKVEIPWCDSYIWYDEMDPFRWCAYIRDAYAVATCAFHGLMFSVVYNKRIWFGATSFMKDKAGSFLDYLGLKEILIDNQDFKTQMEWNWDYGEINERIKILRDESSQWLADAIGESTGNQGSSSGSDN